MKTLRLGLVASLVLLVFANSAIAEPRVQFEPNDTSRQRGRAAQPAQQVPQRISAGEAAARVQARTGGRVLSVTQVGNSYRVKILNRRAQVMVFTVDARTGAVHR
ncbi:MAG: PepSY domain-containing protein [Granulosicoccaceae bacterium]